MTEKKPSRRVRERRVTYEPKTSPTMREIRAALGDLVIEVDTSRLLRQLRLQGKLPDREAFLTSLPKLSPPLSATVIEEREEQN